MNKEKAEYKITISDFFGIFLMIFLFVSLPMKIFYFRNYSCFLRDNIGVVFASLFFGGAFIISIISKYISNKVNEKLKYGPKLRRYGIRVWQGIYAEESKSKEREEWHKEFIKMQKHYIFYYFIGTFVSLVGIVLLMIC